MEQIPNKVHHKVLAILANSGDDVTGAIQDLEEIIRQLRIEESNLCMYFNGLQPHLPSEYRTSENESNDESDSDNTDDSNNDEEINDLIESIYNKNVDVEGRKEKRMQEKRRTRNVNVNEEASNITSSSSSSNSSSSMVLSPPSSSSPSVLLSSTSKTGVKRNLSGRRKRNDSINLDSDGSNGDNEMDSSDDENLTLDINWTLYGKFTNLLDLFLQRNNYNNREDIRVAVVSVPTIVLRAGGAHLYTMEVSDGLHKIAAQIIRHPTWDIAADAEKAFEPGTIIEFDEDSYAAPRIYSKGDINTIVPISIMFKIMTYKLDKTRISSASLQGSNELKLVSHAAASERTKAELVAAAALNVQPTPTDCKGLVCAMAHASVHSNINYAFERDPNGIENEIQFRCNRCLASFKLPPLEFVAKNNPRYLKPLAECNQMAPHFKRQCYYYYFAVHHFNSNRQRMQLPYCIRKKIHAEQGLACEGGLVCSDNNTPGTCPTHSEDTFKDAYNYPR